MNCKECNETIDLDLSINEYGDKYHTRCYRKLIAKFMEEKGVTLEEHNKLILDAYNRGIEKTMQWYHADKADAMISSGDIDSPHMWRF